jgi:hypothetical protein
MRPTPAIAVCLLASLPLLSACSGGGVSIKGLDPSPVLSTATLPAAAFESGATRTVNGATVRYINPFAPETLRIHPLTRFINDPVDGDPRIEAHFELADTHGDPVKALGIVSFQLYRDDDSSGSPIQLERWQVDLTDPAANAEPYDRVTRTYRLSLRGVPDTITPTTRLLILAQFASPEGRTLSATHRF